MNFFGQRPLTDSINKFLIKNCGRLFAPYSNRRDSVPGQFIKIPFVIEVAYVCEMDGQFVVVTWRGETVTSEVYRGSYGCLHRM